MFLWKIYILIYLYIFYTYIKIYFYISCLYHPVQYLYVPRLTSPRKWPNGQFLYKYHKILIFQFQISKDKIYKNKTFVETEKIIKEENHQSI